MNYCDRLSAERFVIFLFHGVIEKQVHPVRNYTRKHLEAGYFADVLRSLLEAGGTPISMDDVLAHHESGEPLPPNSFAVTFDDGFANNFEIAAPILADLQMPATFYVTSDFIDSNRMSWVDRVEWAVEQVPTGQLRLPWFESPRVFSSVDEKQRLLDEVRSHVKQSARIEVDTLASEVQSQLGVPETWSSDDPLDLKMTWEQVAVLDGNPLFTVGGHSHNHAILAFLPPTGLARELDLSLQMLRDKAGISSPHYSYPEGLAHCFSEAVIDGLKRRGVKICPSAIDGDNDISTDPFHLRRMSVL